jgi:hypothetical protein
LQLPLPGFGAGIYESIDDTAKLLAKEGRVKLPKTMVDAANILLKMGLDSRMVSFLPKEDTRATSAEHAEEERGEDGDYSDDEVVEEEDVPEHHASDPELTDADAENEDQAIAGASIMQGGRVLVEGLKASETFLRE